MRKIKNKERCGYRGEKKRYSVFRAELNQKWEHWGKHCVLNFCDKQGYDPEEIYDCYIKKDIRNPWEYTASRLMSHVHMIRKFKEKESGPNSQP